MVNCEVNFRTSSQHSCISNKILLKHNQNEAGDKRVDFFFVAEDEAGLNEKLNLLKF